MAAHASSTDGEPRSEAELDHEASSGRHADSSPLIPDADAGPTAGSKYSTTEEEVVTKEDRDSDDADG